MREFLVLKDFVWEHKWRYIWGIIWLVIVDLLQLILPKILGYFTDALQTGRIGQGNVIYYSLLIVAAALGVAFFRFLWRMYIQSTARLLEYTLRNKLFAHLEKLSPQFYEKYKTGDLMAHATNDLNAVRMSLGAGLVMLVDTLLITTAAITIMAVTIDWRLTLVGLLPLPIMAIISLNFGQAIHSRFTRVQETFSHLTDRVQENISGIRVVKSFAREEREQEKFSQANQLNVDANMQLVKLWGLFFPLIQLMASLGFLIALGLGGIMVIRNQISLGDFVAFNSYLALLTWPIMAMGWVVNILQRGAASMGRINKIMNTEPDIKDPSDKEPSETSWEEKHEPLENMKGEVEFRNLTFSYGDKEVLKNINFKISPGQTLAIVGPTGSGKSTILNLLLKLYNPPLGTLFVDGKDIHQLPLAQLRSQIGYVPQEGFLFSTTIRKNITLGDDYSQEEIIQVCQLAGIWDDIVSFPQGLDTIIGERGVTLSGGQKQRISIARALIKKPTILALDDSLSAVDTRTEEKILRNLKQLRHQQTNIIIAHRISTVKHADHIILLDRGNIVEEGNHEELLAKQGLYWRIYEKQLLEEKLERSV